MIFHSRFLKKLQFRLFENLLEKGLWNIAFKLVLDLFDLVLCFVFGGWFWKISEKKESRCSFLSKRDIHQVGMWSCECCCGASVTSFNSSLFDHSRFLQSLDSSLFNHSRFLQSLNSSLFNDDSLSLAKEFDLWREWENREDIPRSFLED